MNILDGLTDHQRRLITYVCQGYTTQKQLAKALGIKPKTIDRHVQNINERLGTCSLLQIALIAAASGVPVAPPEQIVERNRA
jgi:DNA-binding CsgD family transcriptional regulator